MQVREKVEKLRINVFFPIICGSERSNSRFAKAADAKPSGQMRDEKLGALLEIEMSKKCTPLRREAHFEVKSVKN